MTDDILRGLALRSTITSTGELRLRLEDEILAAPGPGEVIVRVEAAPLNPSDLGTLLGPADLSTLRVGEADGHPTLTATIPRERMGGLEARLDQPLPIGNEGAGTVVAAGAEAKELLGRRVGMIGGGMYAQYRRLPAGGCVVLPDDATAADGAAMFVNPLTALAMVETLRREGHTALVHTAAASNLGQMLVKVCRADGVGLVNVVRNPDQAAILEGLGAEHVVDSSRADFADELTEAIAATGATLAFDAVGGGSLASAILHAMERAARDDGGAYSLYGSTTLKQVYIYGSLDPSPTVLDRGFGMSWSVGGFLLTWFLQKIGLEEVVRLRERVARELKTTFASTYTATLSLTEALEPENVAAYARRATGQKYLIDPSL